MRILVCLALCAQLAHAEDITIYTDVTLQRRATPRARALLAITAGETVELLAETDGWLKVRARGKVGWVPRDSTVELITEPPPIELAALLPPEPDPEVVEEEAPEAPRTLDVQLAAGLTVMTQGFRTSDLDESYNLGVTLATLALRTGYTRAITARIQLGAELAYAVRKALPGIRGTDPETGDAVTTPFAIHDASLLALFGYDTGPVVVLARAGVRAHAFEVADAEDELANPSRIPSESRIAPVLGAGLAIPHVTSRLGLAFAVDAFVARTTQTPGQEDGTKADTRGLDLESALTYRWHPGLDVRVTYALGIAATDFGAPDPMSARAHAGTAITRLDVAHGVTVGIAKGF